MEALVVRRVHARVGVLVRELPTVVRHVGSGKLRRLREKEEVGHPTPEDSLARLLARAFYAIAPDSARTDDRPLPRSSSGPRADAVTGSAHGSCEPCVRGGLCVFPAGRFRVQCSKSDEKQLVHSSTVSRATQATRALARGHTEHTGPCECVYVCGCVCDYVCVCVCALFNGLETRESSGCPRRAAREHAPPRGQRPRQRRARPPHLRSAPPQRRRCWAAVAPRRRCPPPRAPGRRCDRRPA
jgi:hypothetical protein